MSFEAGMSTFLSASLSVGSRVYPERLPQGVTTPALVWQLIPSVGPLYTHDGDAGCDEVRVQFDCWAATYDAAVALLTELRALISGYSGTWGDVAVGSCRLEGWHDEDEQDAGLHRRSVDALIQYQATS